MQLLSRKRESEQLLSSLAYLVGERVLGITGKLNPLALIFAGPIHVVVERLVGKATKRKKGKESLYFQCETEIGFNSVPGQNGYLLFVVA